MSRRTDWQGTVLPRAAAIVNSYTTGVTLRQCFYRLVAEGLIENTQSRYQQLSRYTAEARRSGTFPDFVDTTRSIHRPSAWDSPSKVLADVVRQYRRDRTEGQCRSVYVGSEKRGIVAQLTDWFGDLGIPTLELGGYSSQTYCDAVSSDVFNGPEVTLPRTEDPLLAHWVRMFEQKLREKGEPIPDDFPQRVLDRYLRAKYPGQWDDDTFSEVRGAILIYAGDFDPSGEDIDRDFVERSGCWEKVVRVALNPDQVEEYNLPPAMGKAADPRAGAFIAKHGQLVQVELDALPPDTLQALYQEALEEWWDPNVYTVDVAPRSAGPTCAQARREAGAALAEGVRAMSWVEKRTRGKTTSYRARYRGPDGKERTRSFRLKREAERFLAENAVAVSRGEWIKPEAGKLLYRDWHAEWAPTRVNKRASTLHRDDSYLRNYILEQWGTTPLARIGSMDVQRWVAELAQGLAPATVQKIVGIFATSLDAAVKDERLAKNPARGIELPTVETDEMRFLDPSQVDTLAETIDPRYRALVLTLAYGGLRIGEALALPRTAVDALRATVSVQVTASWVAGTLHLNQPKTKAGRRTVRLPRGVMDELVAHLASHDEEIVFPAPKGGYLAPSRFRGRYWTPATKRAGLEGLRIHDLRHTAVSLWIAAGMDLKQVATQAGHTSVSFTLDRYGHLFPDHDEKAMGALEGMYAAARGGGDVVAIR